MITQNIISDFTTILLSIVIEALPFVVIGVLASTLVELFIKPEWIIKLVPKNRVLSHVILSLLGVLMPVCECGNVPVARRLRMHGLNPSQTITFLLAAPIINPITFWTTWAAFNFDHSYAVIRVISAFFISNFTGILFSFVKDQKSLLTKGFNEEVLHCDHDHENNKVGDGLQVFQKEFISVMKLLVFGAVIASLTQTVVPRSVIEGIGQSPFLSIIAMIILAFVVSICANIDAFFAASYINSFSKGSLISFMVFGPMIDMKILMMLKNTFKPKVLLIITILVAEFSVLTGLLVNYFN